MDESIWTPLEKLVVDERREALQHKLRAEREINRLEHVLELERASHRSLEEECRRLEESLLDSSTQFERTKADTERSKELEATLETTTRHAKEAQTELDHWKSVAESRRDEIIQLNASLRDVSTQLLELVKWKGDSHSELSEAAKNAIQLAAQQYDIQALFKENQQRLETAEADRAKLATDLTQAKAWMAAQESEHAQAALKVIEELTTTKKALAKLEKERDDMAVRIGELERENRELQSTLAHQELLSKREIEQLGSLADLHKKAAAEAEEKNLQLQKIAENAAQSILRRDRDDDGGRMDDFRENLSSRKPAKRRRTQAEYLDLNTRDLETAPPTKGEEDSDEAVAATEQRPSFVEDRTRYDALLRKYQEEIHRRDRTEQMLRMVQKELEQGAVELQKQASHYHQALKNESRLAVQMQSIIREKENALELAKASAEKLEFVERQLTETDRLRKELERHVLVQDTLLAERAQLATIKGSPAFAGGSPLNRSARSAGAFPLSSPRRILAASPGGGLSARKAPSPRTPAHAIRPTVASDEGDQALSVVKGGLMTPAEVSLSSAAKELSSVQKRQEELIAAIIAQRDMYRGMMSSK